MGRALDTILDPPPTSDAPIWDYFGSECAYCRRPLDKKARYGDIDHADADGGNHLGNLVLACPPCNGDEKRETPWLEFLEIKVSDPELRESRRKKILDRMVMHPASSPGVRVPEVEAKVAEIRQLIDDFGKYCAELRTLLQEAAGRSTS